MSRKLPAGMGIATADRRFWAKVKKGEGEDSCWEWVGAKSWCGYGHFGPGRPFVRENGTSRNIYAHRWSFELHTGMSISGPLRVLHKCDNPGCVRPDHLFLGTQADNIRDMVAKGRQKDVRGEANPHARLSDEQIAEIRARSTGRYGEQTALAEEYGVTQAYIGKIIHGKNRVLT